MDIGRIFSRSLEVGWKYRVLWLFALVMGLTSLGGGTNFNYSFNGANNPFTGQSVAPLVIALAVLVGLILFVIWLALVFYFRFVARGALVATVRDIEAQVNPTLREAWRNGRTFYTRLLGLGLLVNVPLALVTIVLILLGFVPLIGVLMAQIGARGLQVQNFAGAWIAAALAICCAIVFVMVLHLAIHPLYEIVARTIVFHDVSVREGIRQGLARARQNLGDVLVVYLLLIGARIGYGLVTAIVVAPVGLVLVLGSLALLREDLNVMILLGLMLALPLWLLFGALEAVFQLFEANVWTETYLALEEKTRTTAV
jgi:hypothetical protein